ncbi:MAG: D-alanine--D-alanine ligase family protein [Anaerolineales bacterium]
MVTVALLFGGRSGEHEVSLLSARSVLSVLDRARFNVIEIGITHEGAWLTGENALAVLEQGKVDGLLPVTLHPDPHRPGLYVIRKGDGREFVEKLADVDVYFPILHGSYGEDGTLQGLFEMADVAYVGAGVVGSSVGMDKGVFKEVMRAQGIPVVESMIALRSEIESDIESIIRRAEAISAYPLFVKPANLGSSVGVTKCRTRSDLAEGLMDAAQYDRRVLIERGVPEAREIEISILGNDHPQVSLAGEIIPGADFYSYDAKYILDNSQLIIPAALTETQAAQVREYAIRAFKAVDACGMARADFFVSKSGEVFLNELNTIPGFTQISMYPKLWQASGLAYPELVNRLIELALERKMERDRTVRTYRRPA